MLPKINQSCPKLFKKPLRKLTNSLLPGNYLDIQTFKSRYFQRITQVVMPVTFFYQEEFPWFQREKFTLVMFEKSWKPCSWHLHRPCAIAKFFTPLFVPKLKENSHYSTWSTSSKIHPRWPIYVLVWKHSQRLHLTFYSSPPSPFTYLSTLYILIIHSLHSLSKK